MQKEIGSSFDLDPNLLTIKMKKNLDIDLFNLKGSDCVFLSTGRGAEGLVLDTIIKRNPKLSMIALVPPFTCSSVLEPFVSRKFTLISYPINSDLSIDINAFRSILVESKANIVLIQSYFGFNTMFGLNTIIDEYSSKGVFFIEDITHNLYSNFERTNSDYTVGSLRKWLPLPDGGIATCKTGKFDNKPVEHDITLERLKLEASYIKFKYIHEYIGEKQNFLEMFSLAEKHLDNQSKYYLISPSSSAIQVNYDLGLLKKKRRENYCFLYKALSKINKIKLLTPELSDHDVPLYLSITLYDRDRLQKHLSLNEIYAPIIWPKPTMLLKISKEVNMIYNQILSIPCDQRYDESDMKRIVKAIEEFVYE